MNIGFGWFGGHIKHELDKLIGMADDISTFTRKDDSDALIIVASYYSILSEDSIEVGTVDNLTEIRKYFGEVIKNQMTYGGG